MKATIRGLERLDYTNKDGKKVDGVKIHVERKDPNVVGLCLEQIYLGSDALTNLGVSLPPEKYKDAVGKGIEYEYNRFGRIANIFITA